MISRRLPLLATLTLLAVACGNYSNEDLEFMNALPDGDLAATMPARSSAITDAEEAELARLTHQFNRTFNGMVANIVGLVDAIRSYPPSTRTSDSRTWGPYPAEKHPGWHSRMIVQRDDAAGLFRYEIAFHPDGGADTDWPVLLNGSFQVGGPLRRRLGHFEISTAAVRAEGLDPGFGLLDVMNVDYQTGADPSRVNLDVTNLPNPAKPDNLTHAVYTYQAAADGQGQMTFDMWGNFVAGPALEKVTVTSQWLGSGVGRGVLKVGEGDGAGATQTECWDAQFVPTYNNKPWMTMENTGAADLCPDIPLLPAPAP